MPSKIKVIETKIPIEIKELTYDIMNFPVPNSWPHGVSGEIKNCMNTCSLKCQVL